MTQSQTALRWILETIPEFGEFWKGYIQAMGFTAHEWIEGDQNPEPLFPAMGEFGHSWNVWDEIESLVSADQLQELFSDAFAFWNDAKHLIDDHEQAGTDFHFTRNEHGVGFWDGDWQHGDELTAMSKPYGTCEMEGTRVYGELTEIYFGE